MYLPLNKRPKKTGKGNRSLTYRKDISTTDIAIYTLPGDQQQGGFGDTTYVGARGTNSLYQVLTDGRMVLQRNAGSTHFFGSVEATLLNAVTVLDSKQTLLSGHSLGAISALELEKSLLNLH